jgi:hypothetical protein
MHFERFGKTRREPWCPACSSQRQAVSPIAHGREESWLFDLRITDEVDEAGHRGATVGVVHPVVHPSDGLDVARREPTRRGLELSSPNTAGGGPPTPRRNQFLNCASQVLVTTNNSAPSPSGPIAPDHAPSPGPDHLPSQRRDSARVKRLGSTSLRMLRAITTPAVPSGATTAIE